MCVVLLPSCNQSPWPLSSVRRQRVSTQFSPMKPTTWLTSMVMSLLLYQTRVIAGILSHGCLISGSANPWS